MKLDTKETKNGNSSMVIGVALALVLAIAGGILISSMKQKTSDQADAYAEGRDNPVNTEAIRESTRR